MSLAGSSSLKIVCVISRPNGAPTQNGLPCPSPRCRWLSGWRQEGHGRPHSLIMTEPFAVFFGQQHGGHQIVTLVGHAPLNEPVEIVAQLTHRDNLAGRFTFLYRLTQEKVIEPVAEIDKIC